MILLDTSVLVELFRIKDKHKSFFYRLAEKENAFSISVITHYEIMVGSNDSQDPFWEKFFESISILPFDTVCSGAAVKIYKELKSKNKMIDLADITVAATAIANKLPLATLNKKHFDRVRSLELV